jgi:hypothetical protein
MPWNQDEPFFIEGKHKGAAPTEPLPEEKLLKITNLGQFYPSAQFRSKHEAVSFSMRH